MTVTRVNDHGGSTFITNYLLSVFLWYTYLVYSNYKEIMVEYLYDATVKQYVVAMINHVRLNV